MEFHNTLTGNEYGIEKIRLSQSVDLAKTNEGNIQNIEESTLNWINYCMKDLIQYIGDLYIDEITSQRLYDWHQQVSLRTSAITANNYLRAFNIVFNRLVKKELLVKNSGSFVPYLEEPESTPRAIQHKTYWQLRNHADTRMKAMLDLLWASGCRRNGLLSINLQTVEIWDQKGELCLAAQVKEKGRRGRRRGQRFRTIYANGEYAQSVVDWMQIRPENSKTQQLFTTFKGTDLSESTLSGLYRRLKRRAEIKPHTIASIQSFRHAFAIRKLDEGYDLATVSAWLGHSDPAFTAKTYCIRREDELRRIYFK